MLVRMLLGVRSKATICMHDCGMLSKMTSNIRHSIRKSSLLTFWFLNGFMRSTSRIDSIAGFSPNKQRAPMYSGWPSEMATIA